MADEFDYASIIADPNIIDPEYDISRIRTTTPTSERLLAAVPEYSGLRFDPTKQSVYSDLYSLYSGGLDSYLANVDPSTGTVDTSVGTGIGGGGGGDTAQIPGAIDTLVTTPDYSNVTTATEPPGGGDPDMFYDPYSDVTTAVAPPSILNPADTTPDYSNVGTSNPRLTARATPISEMGTRPPDFVAGAQTFTDPDPGATNPRVSQEVRDALAQTPPGGGDPDMFYDEPVNLIERDPMGNPRLSGAKTVTTTPDYTYDPMDPPMLGDTGASMDYMSGALDAPYGVNPNTGVPYQEPRTIADQNRILGQTFETKDVSQLEKFRDNFVQTGQDIGNFFTNLTNEGIDVGRTAGTILLNYLGKSLTNVPLLGTAIGMLPPGGPTFQTQKAIELGLVAPGETQDKYGINTQSMMGDYDQYNIDRVEQLEGIVADQKLRGLTNTIQMKELEDRREYVDRSGAGGDIQPDATDLDIATGILTGDAAAAEDAQDLNLMDVRDEMAGIETGDASLAERIAAADRAAAAETQRIENERAANAREEARANAAREAAAQAEAEARAAARERARQPAPTYTPPSPHRPDGDGGNRGGNTGSGSVSTGAGRNPWGI